MQTPVFRLWLWSSRLLFIGPSFDAERHRHHAAQICVGLDAPLRMRGDDDADWRRARGFHVPPDLPHRFDADGTPCALLLLEAQGRECARACRHHGEQDIAGFEPDPSLLTALHELAAHGGGALRADIVCTGLMGGRAEEHSSAVDPRLTRVMHWVDANLHTELRLAAIARAAGVSSSWLSHHFGDAIGLPLRRYILWRRLRRAVETALDGASLTEAAHHAGFADSAHLSRSFRDTFGIAPSFLFQRGLRGDVVVC
jgi:AraC family transcriptional regulator